MQFKVVGSSYVPQGHYYAVRDPVKDGFLIIHSTRDRPPNLQEIQHLLNEFINASPAKVNAPAVNIPVSNPVYKSPLTRASLVQHLTGRYPIEVYFYDRVTGHRALHHDTARNDDDGSFFDFPWTEHNYACDCNRSEMFAAAKGLSSRDEGTPYYTKECNVGPNRFVIEKIVRVPDGKIVYEEKV